jgi:hypothetical protein
MDEVTTITIIFKILKGLIINIKSNKIKIKVLGHFIIVEYYS